MSYLSNKTDFWTDIAIVIVICVLSPLITFWIGYVTGMLCNLVLGERLVDGLNYLFNTERFTKDMIPLTTATLSVVGSFFKSTSSSRK